MPADLHAAMEKSPLSSKKFLAYLISEFTWKLVLVVTLLVFKSALSEASAWGWWFMISIVLTAGFLEVAFIGGQTWLDKYVRVASIIGGKPGSPPTEPPIK